MRHTRKRMPITVTDDDGRVFVVPQGGDEDDGEEGGGEGEGSEEGSEGDGSEGDSGDSDGEEGESGDDADKPQFTQAQLDKAINERIARERKKAERKAAAEKRKAKESGNDPDESAAKITAATTRAVKAEAKAAAIAAGVDPKRAARFVGLADLDDVETLLTDDGDIDDDAIGHLVEETLEDWPEFKPGDAPKPKPGSAGAEDHKGDDKRTKVWTRAEIAALSEKDYEANREAIQEQIRKGLVA